MNDDNHVGLLALAFIVLAVAVCIIVFALDGCAIDGSDDVDWMSMGAAITAYKQSSGISGIATKEITCCWTESDLFGNYNVARVIFQYGSSSTITVKFYCYTSGIYADIGWFY